MTSPGPPCTSSTTTTTATATTTSGHRQKRMGPAPFASFEDLSDELESPDDKSLASSVVRLPGIREDGTPTTPSTTTTIEAKSPAYPIGISLIGATTTTTTNMSSLSAPKKQTPRIDISRASSSSHHDSRDSTPDRELFDSHDPNSAKLGLGFREDGTLDLRSSTEELDFHEPSSSTATTGHHHHHQQPNEKRKGKTTTSSSSPATTTTTAPRPQSPSILMHDDINNISSYHNNHQRKDSQCSDIVLLSISGRTSRLSSIGSQGSAQSRLSNASHLSVMSGQSGISRSSSPHKMVLETSFCGTKPPIDTTKSTTIEQQTNDGDDNGDNVSSSIAGTNNNKETTEMMEKVLLARKHDPTEAILAEGISVRKQQPQQQQQPPEKPARTIKSDKQCISVVKSDITIKVDKPSSDSSNNTPKLPKKIVSKSGVEYIYIPLKGPLPVDSTDIQQQQTPSTSQQKTKPKLREVKSAAPYQSKKTQDSTTYKSKSATPSPVIRKKEDEPKYIRIRLKPDYMYSDEGQDPPSSQYQQDFQKPETLDIQKVVEPSQQQQQQPPKHEPATIVRSEQGKSLSSTPSASPKLSRHIYDYTTATTTTDSVTPSPSVSRKSSFASLFKSKEAIMSPESPSSTSNTSSCKRKSTLTGILREASDSIRDRSRSRSKSREREKTTTSTTTTITSTAPSSTESIDSKTKNKSVLSIFKTNSKKSEQQKKCEQDTSSSETLPSIDGIGKVEFKFNDDKKLRKYETPLDGDSIRIPLHSPTYYEERNLLQDWKTSSQDSQETVIDASSRNVIVDVEPSPKKSETSNMDVEKQICSKQQTRQSSTSSDNVVFTTKLGSNNEIFTTKLPKQKQSIDETTTTTTTVDVTKVEINGHESDTKEEKKIPKTISVTNIQDLPITIPTMDNATPKLILKETHITTVDSITPTPQLEQKEKQHVRQISEISSNRSSILADEERNSSESERDSEMDFPSVLRGNNRRELDLKLDLEINETERKGLVLQQDSFDDELPYVPTTLPLERSAAVPIVPIKQRTTFEMKTKPIERPRSTTPINPSCLEEYCEEVMGTFNVDNVTKTIEKLKISLPRHESQQEKQTKIKSPRKTSNTTTNWFEFAEKTTPRSSGDTTKTTTTPPPLPPKGIQKNWINFEEIPEKRKAPKRIQTIPSRGHIDVPESVLHDNVVYNYVNPEECKCECHEINAKNRGGNLEKNVPVQEDELPLLDDDVPEDDKNGNEITDRCRSLIGESTTSRDSNGIDPSLRTPFTTDLGVSSNRSSIISQDESQSPGSPNAFPKIS